MIAKRALDLMLKPRLERCLLTKRVNCNNVWRPLSIARRLL